MKRHTDESVARRVIRELLKQTRGNSPASIETLSAHASCSPNLCEQVISESGLILTNGLVRLSGEARVDLAMAEANRGFLHEASKFLEWRDFERFAERCLGELGFETNRDVRITAEGRRWQIDVTGLKGSLLVSLDCKHWAPPLSPSRFKDPEAHQIAATRVYAQKLAREMQSDITSLPIIVTLFEPQQNISERTIILEIQKLPSLLRDLTPFDSEMPFIKAYPGIEENPISQ